MYSSKSAFAVFNGSPPQSPASSSSSPASSPTSIGTSEPERAAANKLMWPRFCGECASILLPYTLKAEHKEVLVCNICSFSSGGESETAGQTRDQRFTGRYEEIGDACCLARKMYPNTHSDIVGVTKEIAADPSTPRALKTCPVCHDRDAVFFQSRNVSSKVDVGMGHYYLCCSCESIWQEFLSVNKKSTAVRVVRQYR